MNCPVCKTELRMTERQGVEIDYCPNCRGVWLDRGELDKIIDRAGGPGDFDREPEERRYREGEHRERPHHGKRKSFWREMFDFD